MKWKFLFIFLVLLAKSKADDPGNCAKYFDTGVDIDFDANNFRAEEVTDIIPIKVALPLLNTISIFGIPSGSGSSFLEAVIEDNTLIFRSFANFTEDLYDESLPRQPAETYTMTLIVQMKCDPDLSATNLNFIQTVRDTNNHDPAFSKTSYEYQMTMPLYPKIDLTSLGDPITATDIDFSNQNIIFTISDDWILETVNTADPPGKEYKAVLQVPKYKTLSGDTNLTITATDSGSPPRSSTATVVIKVDSTNSLVEIPTFSKSLYKYKYSLDSDGNVLLTPEEDGQKITITSSADVTVAIDDKTYFDAKYDAGTKTITILPVKPVDLQSDASIVLILTASDGTSTGTAIVMVEEVPSTVSLPVFTDTAFWLDYSVDTNGNPVLTPESGEISIKSSDPTNTKVALEDGTGSGYKFVASYDGSTGIVTVTLSEAIENSKESIVSLSLLTFLSSYPDDTSKSTVLIKLPSDSVVKVPQFSDAFYSANYVPGADSDSDTVSLERTITVSDGATVTLEGDQAKSFSISYNDITKFWDLSIATPLDNSTITEGKEIVLSLISTFDDDDDIDKSISRATLIIDLPEKILLMFSQPYYTAKYHIIDGSSHLNMTSDNIRVNDATASTNVGILDSSGSTYFTVIDTTDSWELVTKETLPSVDLESQEYYILTLIASDSTNPVIEQGLASVFIEFPATPRFDKTLYLADYQIDIDTATVTLKDPISIISENDFEISLDATYQDYFELTSDSNPTITVKKNLDLSDLQDELLVSIQVSLPSSSKFDTAIIAIQLPNTLDQELQFTDSVYSAEYKVDSDSATATVVLSAAIDITPIDNIEFALIENYADNFKFDYNGDPQISVIKLLDDTILQKNQEILLVLEATIKDTSYKETTVIQLKLPVQESLKFDAPNYIFSYIDNSPPAIDNSSKLITLTNTDDSVTFKISSPYNNNFDIVPESTGYTLSIKNALTPETLDINTDIILTIQASLGDTQNAFATILLNLPKKESVSLPQLSQTLYIGDYTEDTIKLETGKSISTVNPNSEVSLETSDYSDNFALVKDVDSGTYTINVTKPLETELLNTQPDIILTLQAKTDDVEGVGTATLVIRLPKTEVLVPAVFSSTVYKANYSEDGPTVSSDTIELTGDNQDSTVVTLSTSDYSSYFKLSTSAPYTLDLQAPLDDSTLDNGGEIVLILEAKLEKSDIVNSATLIIALPEIPLPPKFSQEYYEGKYTAGSEGTLGKIELSNDIKTDQDGLSGFDISITVSNDNYDLQYNDDTKSYDLIVSKDLDSTLFNPSLYITLQATIGRSLPSYAVVIVNLLEDADKITPKFSNSYYFGDYADDILTINSGRLIEIISDYSDTTIVKAVDSYADNFKFDNTDGTIQATVLKPLSGDILNKEKEIYVSIEASLTGSTNTGKAVLIVSLPTSDKKVPPKFTKTYYTALYIIDTDDKPQITMSEDQIAFSDPDSDLPEASLDNYQDYFDINRNGDIWEISIKNLLDDNVLKNNTELAVIVKGVLANAMDDTSATLLIKLPGDNLDIITFDNAYYQANYNIGTDKDSIEVVTPIKLSDAGADTTLEGEYKDNFLLECSETTCSLTLQTNLDSDVLIKEKQILLVMRATTAALFESATATIIVNLPLQTLETLQFTESVYTATYEDSETVTLDQKIALEGVDLDEVHIELTGDNKDSFDIKITAGEVVLSTTGLAQSVIDKEVSILLSVQASKIDDSTIVGTVPLVINLPKKVDDGETPTFTQRVYHGDYSESSTTIALDKDLALADSGIDISTVNISVTPSQYTFTTVAKDDHWELLIDTLPDGTIDSEIALILSVTAKIPDKTASAEATIVITLPKKISPTAIYFEDNVYYGKYTHETDAATISIDKSIKIERDADFSAKVSTEDFAEYFAVFYESGVVAVDIIKPLTKEILNNNSVISLTLKAEKDSETILAALVIELPSTGKVVGPSFTSDVYSGDYTESGTTITLDKNIALQDSTIDISTVDIKIAENANFKFTLTPKGTYWELSLDTISETTLNTEIALLLEITAVIPDESTPAETKVVVKLPKKVSPTVLYFGQNVYSAAYDDTTGTISVDQTIQIFKDDDNEAEVSITDEEYIDNFAIKYTSGVVDLSVKTPFSEEQLKDSFFITLHLQAVGAGATVLAGVVVQLPGTPEIEVTGFDSNIYYADYIDSTNTIVLDSKISLTDSSIDISTVAVEVTPNSDYQFELVPQSSDWTLKVANLASDIVDTEIILGLKVTAKIPGQATSAETSIVIRLPKKISNTIIYFDNTVYSGTYSIDNDNTAMIEIEDDINILGKADDIVSVMVIKDYAGYFRAVYDTGKVTIKIITPLSADILKENSFITLTLSAAKDDDVVLAAVVVTLPFTGEAQQPSFSNDVYSGAYLDSASNIIALDNQISLADSTIDISTVTVTVTPSNSADFTVTLTPKDNYWEFSIDKISNSVIDTEIVLVFTLSAKIPDKTLPAEATVIITLPKKISATSIYFEDTVYLADYIQGDKDKIDVDDDIKLIRDADSSAKVSLSGDYEDYFSVSYSNNKVTITLSKSLPDKVLEENASITLIIKAEKEDDEVLAALVIKLPKSESTTPGDDDDSGDNTGLIAAVSVLAVLLVACIVGSVVFYYLKFKRGSSAYNNMDEPHFRKHSSPSDGKLRVDHPTRRPTGVIKLPLTDVVVTETNTDAPEVFDRKKSVQFDTVNTDELVIEPDEQIDEDENEDRIYDSIRNEDNDENSTNL